MPTGMRMGMVKAAMRKIKGLYQRAIDLRRGKHQVRWYKARI